MSEEDRDEMQQEAKVMMMMMGREVIRLSMKVHKFENANCSNLTNLLVLLPDGQSAAFCTAESRKIGNNPQAKLYSSDFSLWSLACVGFPWSVENKNCWTRMNCHYCRFLACSDRPGAALSPLPRSSEIRDAVGTYRVSLRTWFCSLEEGAARAALRALQLGLGLGYLLDSWCAQSEALFRDHTTDAACGASSEREPRCRSAVSILAYSTISFPGHFWFCFSLKESCLGSVFRVLSRFLWTFWDYW